MEALLLKDMVQLSPVEFLACFKSFNRPDRYGLITSDESIAMKKGNVYVMKVKPFFVLHSPFKAVESKIDMVCTVDDAIIKFLFDAFQKSKTVTNLLCNQ